MSLYDFVKGKIYKELISSMTTGRDDKDLIPFFKKDQQSFLRKYEKEINRMTNEIIKDETDEYVYTASPDLYREFIYEYGLYDHIFKN